MVENQPSEPLRSVVFHSRSTSTALNCVKQWLLSILHPHLCKLMKDHERFVAAESIPILLTTFIACENRRRFATFDGVPAKWRLRSECRNSILMTRHYLDLNSASDWFRSTTQIWVATQLTQIKTDTLIGKFRIPRRPWGEHDCEANAGQRLWKKKKVI